MTKQSSVDSSQRTFTGRYVDVFNLNLVDIHIEDIAHSLANTNRFNGHCRYQLNDAEHSMTVSHFVPDDYKLEALLHDASDAYLGDMVGPVKHHPMMAQFRILENQVQAAIY